jgi:phosphoribosylanthranilate isomerase
MISVSLRPHSLEYAERIFTLAIAFLELELDAVFAGARVTNIRTQKAQEKLPYISLHEEKEYPEEHAALEERKKVPLWGTSVVRIASIS